jgi:endonuclease/exonuclease/phosphatase family metal-dependent hydrolase
MILGGDFNCVLAKTDRTGNFNYGRALNEIVRGFDLVDVWAADPGREMYTHYARQGATRVDWLYVTRDLTGGKCGTETVVMAISDHLAVILLIALGLPTTRRGRDHGFWKTNVDFLREKGSR